MTTNPKPKIIVLFIDDALADIKVKGKDFISIESRPGSKSYKGGTKYFNVYFHTTKHGKVEAWFTNLTSTGKAVPINVTRGIADPKNKEDKRNEYEGTRLMIETTVSRSGIVGEFIKLLNDAWHALITDMVNNGTLQLGLRKIHGFVRDKLSSENKTNPNGIIEDPEIRFEVDFTPYPAKFPHKFLANLPKSQLFDYEKSYKDDNGLTQYRPATIQDDNDKETIVNAENIHLFITDDCVVQELRINLSSAPLSASWLSCPLVAGKVVVEQASSGGFSDDIRPNITNANASIAGTLEPVVTTTTALTSTTHTTSTTDVAKTTSAATTTTTTVTTTEPVTDDKIISNFLDGI